MSTRAALGIWTLALACAAGAAVLVEASDHTSGKLATLLLAIPTALAFIASGILARVQRPQNRTGTLLILVGFGWTLGALTTANNDVVFTAGLLTGTIFTALLAHLLLAFPTGRLTTRADRWIAIAFYVVAIAGPPLAFLFDDGDLASNSCDGPCPDNLIQAFPNQTVANAILLAYALLATGLAAAVLVRLVQRWRRASPALRRALFPVFVTAAALIGLAVLQTIIGLLISEQLSEALNWIVLAAVLAVPISFLYGLTRSRFGATTRRLVAELSEKRDPQEVQQVLRAALRDPTLELGYVARTHPGYVDVHGRPLALPHAGDDRMTTRIGDEILVHDAALADQPELEAVVDATHIALERGLSLRSLEASERRATALLDAIPDSMYRVSRDGTFLEFRLSETARLPVPPEELVGSSIADVLTPGAVEEVSAAMARALDQGTTELVEYTLDQPELRDVEPVRHLEARIVRSGADEVVAIVRDITERKRQEEALEALAAEQAAVSRVALAIATQSAPEVIFDVVTEELGRLLGADAANLVRFAPDSIEGLIVGMWSDPGVAIAPTGTTVVMDGGPLSRVHRTGRPQRGDLDDPDIGPRLRKRLLDLGVTSVVAGPVEVGGELWGAIVVSLTGDQEFPEGVESRIEQFAGLVGVALANAQAREEIESLAKEQAALSRVAVSVATEKPERLFDVVTEEVALRLDADGANLIRFEPRSELDGVVVGTWSNYEGEIAPVGTPVKLNGGPVTRVRRTAQPARGHIDDPDIIPSPLVDRLRAQGVRSIVAAPIVVSGDLWGAVMLSTTGDRTFPADAEARIGQFASLVAVALANAEAHEQLSTLVEEQAAVSRVAVAAATEAPERLFDIVTEETARLFGAKRGSMVRYLDADEVEVVGIWQAEDDPERQVGERFALLGGAITRVKETGRPARVDADYDQDETQRQMVAAPIVVAGELWGATAISSPLPHTFQRGVEERLEKFTRLVAIALANAQAHRSLATLADEQSALSRVAVAVATQEPPERLFNVVSEEVGRLLGARSAATVRYVEDADESVIVGGWTGDERYPVPVGSRVPFQGGAIEGVKRSGAPVRVDVAHVSEEVRRTMASTDVSSQVAAPIVVAGRLWGATSVSVGPTESFSSDAEERLGKFTGLVAVALANAHAREELAGLAEEQAALSRVAVAAATERPDRLFDIVSEEVGRLFGAAMASTSRYAEDGTHIVVVGRWGEGHPFEVGRRVNLEGGVLTRVHETGRPARTDLPVEEANVQDAMRQDGVWSSVAAPIVVSGRLWGGTAISLLEPDIFPEGVEERLGKFTSLVAVALANAEAREELTASRARIVQAGDAARRRLERNLHDGAQQRLVTLSLTLRLAQARLHDDPAAAQELLEASSEELASALEELRELARGLHPAILSDRGLGAALEALATRAPLPVELDHVPTGRLPPPVEAAAYYVVAESLTNVAKYADANSAHVKVEQHDGYAIVEVEDDGVGGVDVTRGSGLRGLADRVEALDGRLTVSSEAGRGTRVRAEIPC